MNHDALVVVAMIVVFMAVAAIDYATGFSAPRSSDDHGRPTKDQP